eukprot:1812570-Prymnesium_polylepis.1
MDARASGSPPRARLRTPKLASPTRPTSRKKEAALAAAQRDAAQRRSRCLLVTVPCRFRDAAGSSSDAKM